MLGTLFVVATPIGNLEDITARALRVLGDVTLIAAEDTRRTAHLLARYAIATPTTSLHAHNETRKTAVLLARLLAGDDVALVSDAGTPSVSDPGQHLIRRAIDDGIRVEPIPGPSAIMAALAASGLDCQTFAFLGFPPRTRKTRAKWFEKLQTADTTVVFFEAPHRIRQTLTEMQHELGDRQIVVARELTKVHEEFVRGPVSKVLELITNPIGELTVVVDIGHTTDNKHASVLSDSQILAEFGEMTASMKLPRRKVIAALARRHHWRANDIYAAIERGRMKSAK
jgi:16S rRNA (cytidine1402-2'-O)-methyltransferase